MDQVPVNSIDNNSNTIRVNDTNTPIKLTFKYVDGSIINLKDKIDYFYLTKDDGNFYSVTDINFEGNELIFKLPNLIKGLYRVEIRDIEGSIYPADDSLFILLKRSFEEGKESYYTSYREDILNNVEPIIIQHIEQNPNKFKGERGQQGFPGREGLPGIDGKDGKDGKDGIDGKDGKDGIDGVQGEIGDPGQIGSVYLPKFRLDENSNLYYYALPNVIKNGLVLWYDFTGKTNSDQNRTIAEDLSGNGNHGTLQNFNFTAESGYSENKLLFDGVDDKVISNYESSYSEYTVSISHSNLNNDNASHFLFYKDNLGAKRSWSIRKEVRNYRLLVWESSATGYRNIVLPISSEKLNVISLVHSLEFIDVYINGERITRVNSLGQGGIFNDQKAEITGGYPVGSVKIYNRPLTPEEITHNYAIEKERFDIE